MENITSGWGNHEWKYLIYHKWPKARSDKLNIFTSDYLNHKWYFPNFFQSDHRCNWSPSIQNAYKCPHHLVLKGFFWQSPSLCNFSSYGQSYVIGSNIIIYWIPTGPLASIHYLGTREPITYFPTKFKTSYLECTLISDILYKVCTFCICHYFW